MKKIILCLFFLTILVASFATAATIEFNGTAYDINGATLNNTNVSIMVKSGANEVSTNSTASNASGWFNITIGGVETNYTFFLSMFHRNVTTTQVDYVGQSLPPLPYTQFSTLGNINFYLQEAGTINITAINSSNSYTQFGASVKDKLLGYPVQSCWSNIIAGDKDYVCYVPKNRNYTVMIYSSNGADTNFVPVSWEWNNFSGSSDYSIADQQGSTSAQSTYNATTSVVTKVFNVSESFARVTGYLNNTLLRNFSSWNNITVVPYVLEPGDMIFSSAGTLPYNTSSFNQQTLEYNKATGVANFSGWFNITLPYAAAETVKYVLYATAYNETDYFAGVRNITVAGDANLNFTLYGMLGDAGNVTMTNAVAGGADWVAFTKKQTFNIVNSTTNATISNQQFHVEATLDYTDYGCDHDITFMEDVSSGAATFSIPMLNVTGFKEVNVYSMGVWAPKREDTRTVTQIEDTTNGPAANISMSLFSPTTLGGDSGSSISIALYRSNSSCDLPSPPTGCSLVSGTMDSFDIFPYIIGGGALSIRMGMGEVFVHYVNVDMFASGAPDALFENDDDVTEGTSGAFSKAMRFGSAGPKIYDYILTSMPYTEGGSSNTGLDEDAAVKMNVSTIYDENWNVIWNTSLNGSSGTALGANFSHYNADASAWSTLMGLVTCTTAVGSFSATTPCYIDTTNDRIWVRLPHFSGTGPEIFGTVASANTSSTTTTSSTSSGSSTTTETATYDAGELTGDYTKSLSEGESLGFSIGDEEFTIEMTDVKTESVDVTIEGTEVNIKVGAKKKIDLNNDGVYDIFITCSSITDGSAEIKIQLYSSVVDELTEDETTEESEVSEEEESSGLSYDSDWYKKWWIWVLAAVLVGLVVFLVIRFTRKKKDL
jgi:hypothetical protein